MNTGTVSQNLLNYCNVCLPARHAWPSATLTKGFILVSRRLMNDAASRDEQPAPSLQRSYGREDRHLVVSRRSG